MIEPRYLEPDDRPVRRKAQPAAFTEAPYASDATRADRRGEAGGNGEERLRNRPAVPRDHALAAAGQFVAAAARDVA
ncbi:hypothetical protein ABZ454_02920 [Streptomyces sp. NPDC005803]|uniref:hypothetical protein n=1 Tax=Streptomyces sp. NPDC005803 TaxID=3154297 RepID=UPI0033FD896E